MLNPRLTISLFNKKIHSFHFFGVMGFIAGVLLGMMLCYLMEFRVAIILLMGLTGAVTFFLLAIFAKIITGREIIVYYHHEIAILITCSIVLKVLGLPVLRYLDITILGIATFLAFGRIGCFNVGCCHGRPAKKGVVYLHKHVEAGFTQYYEGVPLFPVQLIESAFVFIVIISGTFLLLQKSASGTVLILYTVIYGSFRFAIEFYRGDPERPYWKGLSEAQWTTLLLVAISVLLGVFDLIPLYLWHLIISVLLFIVASVVVLRENIANKMQRPVHIRQVAIALQRLSDVKSKFTNPQSSADLIEICQTDLGLNLSKGKAVVKNSIVQHYTISCKKNVLLTYAIAQKIAVVIQQLEKYRGPFEIREKQDAFHILFKE
jgi:prolipoprotein diacylglyceryltransferase